LFSAEVLQVEARRLAEQMLAAEAARVRAEVRQEQVAVFQQASRELLRALQREWHTRLQEVEREAGALVLEIAAKVLQRELEENSLAIVPVVKAALQQVRDQARVQVVLAPVDEPGVQEALADLQAILAQDSRLEIVVDERAQPGGCVVHGEQSSVDARLSTRLEAVRECVETILGAA
jgi:flagellar assembly protein FliH